MTDEELSQVGDTGGDEMSLNRQRAREIALGVGKAAAASLIYLLAFSALFQNFEMFPMGALLLIGPFQLIFRFSGGRLSLPTIFFTGEVVCLFTAFLYLCLLGLPVLVLAASLLVPGLSVVLILWPAFRLIQALLLYISG